MGFTQTPYITKDYQQNALGIIKSGGFLRSCWGCLTSCSLHVALEHDADTMFDNSISFHQAWLGHTRDVSPRSFNVSTQYPGLL